MNMIGHAIDAEQFLLFMADNACNVFEDLVFECGSDEILTPLYREHNVDGDLGICICHCYRYVAPMGLINVGICATDMSPRWG